ncbi:unnamed protein product, partial [Scytosiphon promiscuus]
GERASGSGGLAAPTVSSVQEKLDAVRGGRGEGEREETSVCSEREQEKLARSGSTPQPPPPRSFLRGRIPSSSTEAVVDTPLSPSRGTDLARRPLGVDGPEKENKGGGKRRRRDPP